MRQPKYFCQYLSPMKKEELSLALKGKLNISNHIKELITNAKEEVIICTSSQEFASKLKLFRQTFDILKKFINEHPKTVILTQVNGSEDILQSSFILRIPIILFIRDPFRKQDLLCLRQIREKNQKIWIVFNSNFTSQAKRFDRIRKLIPTSVIYPPIEIDKLKNKDISRANFVTLVNPTLLKGGKILIKLALDFPNEKFLAVQGWYDPKHENLNLNGIKNITFWPSQENIGKVFKVTKILLFPSQWPEPFGRTAVEALAAGIPVIASRCGGLTESLDNSVHFVDHYQTYSAWKTKLNYLLNNKDERNKYNKSGKSQAEKFETRKAIKQLIPIINN